MEPTENHNETIIRRRRWILMSVMALALCFLIVSVLFLARINGWIGGKDETALLTIVDAAHPVSENAYQSLSFLDDSFMVDERCAEELEAMLQACRLAGHHPRLTAAYRSATEQRELLNALTEEYMTQGMSADEARSLALQRHDEPGCSEHQLGLAVDIEDEESEAAALTERWLREHAWEYGFIQRYPQGKESVTHHPYTPAHYRFVGLDAARQIQELDLSLEEYVAMFYGN